MSDYDPIVARRGVEIALSDPTVMRSKYCDCTIRRPRVPHSSIASLMVRSSTTFRSVYLSKLRGSEFSNGGSKQVMTSVFIICRKSDAFVSGGRETRLSSEMHRELFDDVAWPIGARAHALELCSDIVVLEHISSLD